MSDILITKNTVFSINRQKLIAMSDLHLNTDNKHNSYFILDNWDICEYPDIDVMPVVVLTCDDKYELYTIYEDNIIYGTVNDYIREYINKE